MNLKEIYRIYDKKCKEYALKHPVGWAAFSLFLGIIYFPLAFAFLVSYLFGDYLLINGYFKEALPYPLPIAIVCFVIGSYFIWDGIKQFKRLPKEDGELLKKILKGHLYSWRCLVIVASGSIILWKVFNFSLEISVLYLICIMGMLGDGFTTKIGLESGAIEIMPSIVLIKKIGLDKALILTRILGIGLATFWLFRSPFTLICVSLLLMFIVVSNTHVLLEIHQKKRKEV